MLNDLLPMAEAMEAHGFELVQHHPGIQDMGKPGALGIMLNPDGIIVGLLPLDTSERGALWTFREGKHNGFPGLKLRTGLLALPKDELVAHKARWKAAKCPASQRDALDILISSYRFESQDDWPGDGHVESIEKRLAQLAELAGDPETEALPATHERFLLALRRSPGFLADLFAHLSSRDLDESLYAWAAKALAEEKTPILVDVGPAEKIRSVRHVGQKVALSRSIDNDAGVQSAGASELGACALTGVNAQLFSGSFPQPNLPSMGLTYLFARNDEIPAMKRYGRAAASAFSVAAGVPERLDAALTRLAEDAAEGKTWKLIPGEQAGKPSDLLIIYFPGDLEIPLAEALGGEEPAAADVAFQQLTAIVAKHAVGLGQNENLQPTVQVLVLRKVDTANRKTIYSREITAQALGEAAHEWKVAMKNVPDWLTLPLLVSKKLEAGEPPFLPPLSLISVSRRSYTRGRMAGVDVAGIPLTTAYQLFLREGDYRNVATRTLRVLCELHAALLVGLADARAHGVRSLRDGRRTIAVEELSQRALRTTGWIGALLRLAGRFKEEYVKDTAFRLGQLLSAVDTIHIGYCMAERDGRIPPTLLGNSLLTTAGHDPAKALGLLQQRWKPYAAWKRRRKAFQYLPIEETAASLHGCIKAPAARESDTFRAELLLGYMAGFPLQSQAADTAVTSEVEEYADA